ncbi:polysaccharide lyase family 1 protein [Lentzea sp. JNUCC 0626]|uniref:pectate lyase family protein n=1 Tax=Lentzea sp. JNUCC 0626 TaxID=3367513 RepID=UPI00374857B0
MTAPSNSVDNGSPDDEFGSYQTLAELQSAAGGLDDLGTAGAAAAAWREKAELFRRAGTAYEDAKTGLDNRMRHLEDTFQGASGTSVQESGRRLGTRVQGAREIIASYPGSMEGIARAIQAFSSSWNGTMEEGREQMRVNTEKALDVVSKAAAAGLDVDGAKLVRTVQHNTEQQMLPKLRQHLTDLASQYREHGQALNPVEDGEQGSSGGGGNTNTNTGSGAQPNGVTGWATENGGTTGGGDATPIVVTTAEELEAALAKDGPAVIHVKGNINVDGMLKVGSDKTVLGVGDGAGITGGGLNVSDANNVIIRNLNFKGSSDDAIQVERSKNVWIDHNTISNAKDGAVDIKRGSDYVTVSWNHVYDQDKSMMLGHADDNGAEDSGALRVTYDHNWFEGDQRSPRVRYGNPVHVYNNYYSDVDSYGVASTTDAGVLVEANSFENTEDPYHLGEGDSGPGSLVAKDNQLVGSGQGESTNGGVKPIPYTYSPDPAEDVEAIVTGGAGAGKISVTA